ASKETLKEQVVLINGATGFAVQIAVQISKHLGAKTIIATGRNKETLNKLLSLGADKVFNLIEEKDLLAKSIKNNRHHLIINYLVEIVDFDYYYSQDTLKKLRTWFLSY